MDEHDRILRVSPEVRGLLGFDPADVTGRAVTEFMAPDEVEEGLRKAGDLLRSPGALLRSVHRIRHSDGDYRFMEIIARDLRARAEIGAIVVRMAT